MVAKYLSLVLRYAVERSFRLTDRLSVFAALVAPAVFHLWGKAVPERFGVYLAVGILTFVGSVILLRLLTAPYFIWSEQNDEITELEKKLAKPQQIERHRIGELLGTVRARLVDELSEIRQHALRYKFNEDQSRRSPVSLPSSDAEQLLTQPSYDEELTAIGRDYIQRAHAIATKRRAGEDDGEDIAALDRIGRVLFRLLHRA